MTRPAEPGRRPGAVPSCGAAIGLAVALAGLACGRSPVERGPMVDRCGALVAFYLGVDSPVAVTGGELDPETRRARIEYRTERANLPVEGVALCRFRKRADGSFDLSGAFVDESRLRPDEIDAFNAQVHAAAPGPPTSVQ